MNERGHYGKQAQYGDETRVGDSSPVKTFATGALVGGIFVGVAALWLRHAVIKQQELVADINRYRTRTA
jgi:hypothetical protein